MMPLEAASQVSRKERCEEKKKNIHSFMDMDRHQPQWINN